jgi:uncharacterized protein YuzE
MITIAGIDFDYHDYDERGDVLFLHVGEPKPPARAFETPEGHTVEYNEHGAVIGLELMNVRSVLERDGDLQLTWPPSASGSERTSRGACCIGASEAVRFLDSLEDVDADTVTRLRDLRQRA